MTDKVGIGILGCGVVGSAVCDMLLRDGCALAARTGHAFELKRVLVRDANRKRPVSLPPGVMTTDLDEVIQDPDTQIVVELIGGIEPAKTMILDALQSGKDVVTANKALLALHGRELFAAARTAGRCIAFEAAVGGGIPLIESVRRGLIANEIDAVYGILNGTSNYILTQMLQCNVGYGEALAEAQRLGYAEADPTLDVDGTDSAHKLAILASIAMRRSCDFDSIDVQGITGLELTDLLAGDELGYVCKLLAIARNHDDGLDLSVRPTFIRKSHPLANVAGPFNAISIYGHAVGHTLFYGRGAGGMPTASAVVSDIVDVATGNAARTFSRLAVLPDQTPPAACRPPGENQTPFYIRVVLRDRPGGMAKIASALAAEGISIASLVQHDPHETHAAGVASVVATTHPAKDRTVRAATRAINALDEVVGHVVCIPALEEHVEIQHEA